MGDQAYRPSLLVSIDIGAYIYSKLRGRNNLNHVEWRYYQCLGKWLQTMSECYPAPAIWTSSINETTHLKKSHVANQPSHIPTYLTDKGNEQNEGPCRNAEPTLQHSSWTRQVALMKDFLDI